MKPFRLPDLGEGLQQAEIVAWHVAEGDHVVADQPLLSVETEKAVVEIPSPHSGRIAQLMVRPGDTIKVGAPLLTFEEGAHAETGTVVGTLEQAAPQPAPQPQPPAALREAPPSGSAVRAAPAVRQRARTLGVDLAAVSPTGLSGTVTLSDVEAAAGAQPAAAQPLRGARRTMAVNVTRAWAEVAHATLHDAADVKAWPSQNDVTVRLIRAIIAGCAAEPRFNASFDPKTLALRHNERIDLGLAIDGPDGLFVPVLRDVGGTTAEEWRRQIDRYKTAVRERSLAVGDLRAPTFTLSNFGTIAGRHAALIVMPPQVAILGAGRIDFHSLPLSLSFDHRAVSGGEAARFLRAVIADLEQGA